MRTEADGVGASADRVHGANVLDIWAQLVEDRYVREVAVECKEDEAAEN